MSFDEPEEPPTSTSGRGRGKKKGDSDKNAGIKVAPAPVLSLPKAEPPDSSEVVRAGVSQRAKAATNLKLEGASYQEIAEVMEYESAADAKRDVERTLAATHGPEEYETMRLMATARAERQFARSVAMAGADFLVDDEGTRHANTEKLRWHQQASADLRLLVDITGAKAPTKLEVTPGEVAMERLVQQVLERTGHQEILEAEVLDLEQVPDAPELEEGDEIAEQP